MSKEKILNQNLWGVHLPLLDSHYKFKEKILDSMQEYANQENLQLIRFFKQYPGMTKHLTPEFILNQFNESKTNKEQTKDETRIS